FQLATFGSSPDQVRRAFLEKVMIPEALYSEGAKGKKLEQTTPMRERIDDVLRMARLNLLKAELNVTPDEIAAFYVENRGRFDTPERVAVFRILCRTEDEARAVIAEAKQNGGVARWNELTRERSIDKATFMRGGNLGFLAADGSSSEVSVKVDPVLF